MKYPVRSSIGSPVRSNRARWPRHHRHFRSRRSRALQRAASRPSATMPRRSAQCSAHRSNRSRAAITPIKPRWEPSSASNSAGFAARNEAGCPGAEFRLFSTWLRFRSRPLRFHCNGRSAAIPPVLKIVSLVVFASTLFSRAVDPIVPKIAADLAIDVKTAALLSSAFTFPYALMQPALGTIADFFGKTRLMNVSSGGGRDDDAASAPLSAASRCWWRCGSSPGCVRAAFFPSASPSSAISFRCMSGRWRSAGCWPWG